MEKQELYLFHSSEEPFPEDAINEIQKERYSDDLELPPCRVELVIGLSAPQKLYIVLPTSIETALPFSCNAPFLQDPARTSIKNPSLSPTNRWLLHRIGQLAGETMLNWLENTTISINERTEAYTLLLQPLKQQDTLKDDIHEHVFSSFLQATKDEEVLLTTEGKLVAGGECLTPPIETYSIWKATDLLQIIDDEQQHVLTEYITKATRDKLKNLVDCQTSILG
jgi:hypothetical protein